MNSFSGFIEDFPAVKVIALALFAAATATAFAQSSASMPMGAESIPGERLGTVSFAVSCSPAVQGSFNRGVALLHDFWYAAASSQFEQIAEIDPNCAMAHWGIAMSVFHQIWDRPDDKAMKLGWEEIEKARSASATTDRERGYIKALADFYQPDGQDFMTRVTGYSAAMGALYAHYPVDVDAGAFYALSLLASKALDDTSLKHEHDAMSVLTPLIARYPDNPGLVHYIIHSCDNPAMAKDGLAAARHYGEIAPSGPHAAHMPGHIFARLGMWQEDIDSQLAAIQASEAAEAHHESGLMDEPHSYDFLMYAYLQSGQDAKAKAVLDKTSSVLNRLVAIPGMADTHRPGMTGYYQTKFPVFYALETRDWQTAATLPPVAGVLPENAAMTWWARAIADGHLHRTKQAGADLAQYNALIAEVRRGPHAYFAEGTGAEIEGDEVAAWTSFAADHPDDALKHMRDAADLQDKVGQSEVDIPAREMLGDMLLEFHQPKQALAEYRVALKLSPNRFNGLYQAGLAAEQAGKVSAAEEYFAELLKSTGGGASSSRPELMHAKSVVSSSRNTADRPGAQ